MRQVSIERFATARLSAGPVSQGRDGRGGLGVGRRGGKVVIKTTCREGVVS
jgi:hypothetical protein